MKLTVKLLLIVVLGCVFASAQTPSDVKSFAKGGVTFDYPNGWMLQELNNEDALDLVLSRPDNDLQIKVFVHKGRITPEKLPEAKKAFIDPYVAAYNKQFVSMGADPKQSPDASEIGGVKADGVNITASLGGIAGAAKIYWAVVGQRVVVLTLFGPDSDIKKFGPVWDQVRTSLKVEDPKPAASPSPASSP
ncbi:MAG TPA: hypothetical protein VHH35_15820 [Pyrinomonadaceae bacterium]|nr:hypothetical protein [Pyrinomonadaceae bacterium]